MTTTATLLPGEYENAGQMIEAIKAHRAKVAAQEAAEDAAAHTNDPEVRKWMLAAALENSANN